MSKLKTRLFQLMLAIAAVYAFPAAIVGQAEQNAVGDGAFTWLRNGISNEIGRRDTGEFSEDAYYGIEKVEARPKKSGQTNPGDGSGQMTGGKNGSGVAPAKAAARWIPYYLRPSNCRTPGYQPKANAELLNVETDAADSSATLVYRPRPLYSTADYAAKREGSIRLKIELKADGTVGEITTLDRLPGDLPESAVRAACYITFRPAIADGLPVDSFQTITYSFKLAQVAEDSEPEAMPEQPPANSRVHLISRPRAAYTAQARRSGIIGNVKLRVTFLPSGTVGKIVPVEMLADGLTESAVDAAKSIKFEPARKNGKNITETRLIVYSFTPY